MEKLLLIILFIAVSYYPLCGIIGIIRYIQGKNLAWIHEEYPEGRIRDYVNGVEHDLENVTANEGHDLVKDSILEQTKRIADIAVHNTRYRKEWFEEVMGEIKELAKFHSIEVPMVYGDGEETVDKMVSLEELGRILAEIEDAIGRKL